MYRSLMSFVGIAVFALGLVLIFWPSLYVSLNVPVYSDAMAYPAQRFGPAIVGLGALIWSARTLPPSPFTAQLTMISALVWLGIAATGVFHYMTSVANINIIYAAISEVVLGVMFVLTSRQISNA